ncbi:MAG: hypothetical protein JNM55_10580 [Anaerolineales bacterium]|nr:hypothetical protein [Anaerolineales bacterium]
MTQNSLSPSAGFSPDYVMSLERRIMQLENQVQQFEKLATQQQSIITTLSNKLPNTSLLSPSFLARAFTVWGHAIVAQLMVTIPLYCLLFILGDF